LEKQLRQEEERQEKAAATQLKKEQKEQEKLRKAQEKEALKRNGGEKGGGNRGQKSRVMPAEIEPPQQLQASGKAIRNDHRDPEKVGQEARSPAESSVACGVRNSVEGAKNGSGRPQRNRRPPKHLMDAEIGLP
jgi:hypothetical protein